MSQQITDRLSIALAQFNPTLGDIQGNAGIVQHVHKQAEEQGADLIVFSELFLTGYPPEDLIHKPAFVKAAMDELEQLAKTTVGQNCAILLGLPWADDGKVYNAVALLEDGKIAGLRYKVDLPNYGVFDEKRVFSPGPMPGPVNFRGVRIGVPICEDIWREDVCECLEETGAEILLVANGSPYDKTKFDIRMNIAVSRVTETGLPLVYVNQLGGQDELVFDGASFVLNGDRSLAMQMPAWEENLAISQWSRIDGKWVCEEGQKAVLETGDDADYLACVTGLRDYVGKNRFPGVVLGLSGGIDSALCAAMAVDALGSDRVHCVMLPYTYTSEESIKDAAACADALRMRYDVVPIFEPVEAFSKALSGMFEGTESDITEENLQSRARGTILMAISNKFGNMVVTTGNKSEVSVGYATLYGDMNGGFNPIKDLYKTQVYRLSAYRNKVVPKGVLGPDGIVIPENIITKAPTAELRENQTDQDSLPEYDELDHILECLVEKELPVPEIVAQGYDKAVVSRVAHLLYLAEYKRRQAAPGVKITSRNLGRDRRYPITNKFREQ